MRNPAFSHLSPAPVVHRYGLRLRPYDASSSICGHSKPDRAAQILRIRDVYDEGERCFAAGNRPLAAPRMRCVRCNAGATARRGVALPPADLVSVPGNAQAAREDDVARRNEKSMTRRDGLNCRAA
ncbi:hypothetical protein F7R13_00745 [Burkholderia territorii]|uniref:Uncharacterized protein n=1 Tax=Burkholderia territorii TaxID=1503055 RepID=A0A6L3NP71_9BURK|nr:hypothetical protein F7R13_00745 [Burkholderia territorii]